MNGDAAVPYPLGLWYAALIDFNHIIGKSVIKLKVSGEQTIEGVCTCWPECLHTMRVTTLENSAQNVMVNLNHADDCKGTKRSQQYAMEDLCYLAPRAIDVIYIESLSTKRSGARELQKVVKEQSSFDISYRQSRGWLDKVKPDTVVQMAQYQLLRSAVAQWSEQDPDGTYEVAFNSNGTMKHLYIATGMAKENYCHVHSPIFADGAFSSCDTKGILQAAVTMDGNNQIVILCFAIVRSEDGPTWKWFFEHLVKDFPSAYMIRTDQCTGADGVSATAVLEKVGMLHLFCWTHILDLVKKNKAKLKKADGTTHRVTADGSQMARSWVIARSPTLDAVKDMAEGLRGDNPNFYQWIMDSTRMGRTASYEAVEKGHADHGESGERWGEEFGPGSHVRSFRP